MKRGKSKTRRERGLERLATWDEGGVCVSGMVSVKGVGIKYSGFGFGMEWNGMIGDDDWKLEVEMDVTGTATCNVSSFLFLSSLFFFSQSSPLLSSL